MYIISFQVQEESTNIFCGYVHSFAHSYVSERSEYSIF